MRPLPRRGPRGERWEGRAAGLHSGKEAGGAEEPRPPVSRACTAISTPPPSPPGPAPLHPPPLAACAAGLHPAEPAPAPPPLPLWEHPGARDCRAPALAHHGL